MGASHGTNVIWGGVNTLMANKCLRTGALAGVVALVGGFVLGTPFVKASVDHKLVRDANAALADAGITDVTASSSWAKVSLDGPAGAKDAAIAAVGPAIAGRYFLQDGINYAGADGMGDADAEGADANAEGADANAEGADANAEGADANAEGADANADGMDGEGTDGADANAEGTDAGVDAAGLQGQLTELLKIEPILFKTNSAQIQSGSTATLDKAAEFIKAAGGAKVAINGHTDSRGSDSANQTLSEHRAKAVLDYLVSKGVDAGQLSSAGFGETKPISDNESAEGLQANRRIEFVVEG